MQTIFNARALDNPLTGSQRYMAELLKRVPGLEPVRPKKRAHGLGGHLWEQLQLPRMLHGRALWSPSNTGPITVERQAITIHDVVPLDHPEWLQPNFARWYRLVVPRVARRARVIITVSEFSRDRIIATCGVPASKITVVPNGVAENMEPAGQGQVQATCERYGLVPGEYAFNLNSIEPRKNLGRLVEAWQGLAPSVRGNAVLAVGGGMGKEAVFQHMGIDLGQIPTVRLLGRVPDSDLPFLFTGARFFVYPSLYEGFGLPPLEAMRCGTPVIVGNQASLPEVVGEAGLTVDPTQVAALRDAMATLLQDGALCQSLARQGRSRALKFTWDLSARRTQAALEALE